MQNTMNLNNMWYTLFRKNGGAVAQLGERLVRNQEVRGSIPLCSTTSKIRDFGRPQKEDGHLRPLRAAGKRSRIFLRGNQGFLSTFAFGELLSFLLSEGIEESFRTFNLRVFEPVRKRQQLRKRVADRSGSRRSGTSDSEGQYDNTDAEAPIPLCSTTSKIRAFGRPYKESFRNKLVY